MFAIYFMNEGDGEKTIVWSIQKRMINEIFVNSSVLSWRRLETQSNFIVNDDLMYEIFFAIFSKLKKLNSTKIDGQDGKCIKITLKISNFFLQEEKIEKR